MLNFYLLELDLIVRVVCKFCIIKIEGIAAKLR